MNENVFMVDEPMGRGKTSAAINYVLQANPEERFLIITPYKTEVARYKKECSVKRFEEPSGASGSKLEGIKDLFRNGRNIVSTHALFQKFDEEIINLCKIFDYTLIMDEVADVVDYYPLSLSDRQILLKEKLIEIDEDTKQISWVGDEDAYHGMFDEVKNLCKLGCLCAHQDNVLIWLFPIEVFNVFKKTYILTYMFDAQIQRYYYDYNKVNYKYIHVNGDSLDTYRFAEVSDDNAINHNYRELIHIIDNVKMNEIGDRRTALSKNWFTENKDSLVLKKLKQNTYNFFHNICGTTGKQNLWTTFKDFRPLISGKGYIRSFAPVNARATNEFRECTCVAYIANVFLKPNLKMFFTERNIEVDEDGYALSEMLQFIWRSAIREYKPIQLYIPSSRMRGLLKQWIEENSI